MAINYTQTDDDATACSTADPRDAVDGGTPGTSEITLSAPASSSDFWNIVIDPGSEDWNSGDWTIRINVTDGDMDIEINRIRIVHVNSSCVEQADLYNSGGGLGISCTSAEVKTHTASAVDGVPSPTAGDMVVIEMDLQNNNTMFTRTLGVTPDQDIDSPFDVSAEFRPIFKRRPSTLLRM